MIPLSFRPRELDAWRAFEEAELPSVFLPSRWPFGLTWPSTAPTREIRWTPSMEVWEKDDAFIVRAELPGVKKEDIEIFTTKDTITIGGTRRPPSDVKDDEYHRCEVCYGPFSRSIKMTSPIDPDAVEATYEDGMLEIRVAKVRETVPTRIEIKGK